MKSLRNQTCSQTGCDEPASYRYTWPGKKEDFICKSHVNHLSKIVNALGLTLVIIALDKT